MLESLILGLILSATPAPGVATLGVSKCRGEDGAVIYQEGECPPGSSLVEALNLQAEYSAPTGNGVRSVEPPGTARADLGAGHKGNPDMQFVIGESSFECRAGSLVFYRHTYCPAQVQRQRVDARGRISDERLPVSARIVPRAEACAAILAEAATSRPGREYDDLDEPGKVSAARCRG
ncbi:MAG: hypothetical protein MUE46_01010 [Xanthomonadales bacterium]|nr:hypothetical protein [Xanthomonadales bacterium]